LEGKREGGKEDRKEGRDKEVRWRRTKEGRSKGRTKGAYLNEEFVRPMK
jgi:hypothetical protein